MEAFVSGSDGLLWTGGLEGLGDLKLRWFLLGLVISALIAVIED